MWAEPVTCGFYLSEIVLWVWLCSKNYIDNDINISVDQTKKLAKAIREGSHFPEAENGYFSHKMVYKFLDELRQIFDWDRYEYSTLGRKDKDGEYRMLSWYAVILS